MAMKQFFNRRSSAGAAGTQQQAAPSNRDSGQRVFEMRNAAGVTYETVLVDGSAQGSVMRRSEHFVVWSEKGNEVHVQGDAPPSRCVARMWEGPRGAAISDDEQWCVVIGLGLVAFRLRPGTEVQSHGRRPYHERWQLHHPMSGDLADAVLFTGVKALGAHQFAVATQWGLGNMWTTRVWVYDADTNTLGEPRDIINEQRRSAAVRPQRSAAYAEECQLAAAQRFDGAESTAEAGMTFELNSSGGEVVLAEGKQVGSVMCRSQRFVVWQTLGCLVSVEGDGLPWLLLADMYGGAAGAAISDDEQWCVVVGCGFRARRLRVAGEFRSHGDDPRNILWLSGVEALDGHTFRLRSGGVTPGQEYLYDADTDGLRPVRANND